MKFCIAVVFIISLASAYVVPHENQLNKDSTKFIQEIFAQKTAFQNLEGIFTKNNFRFCFLYVGN